MESIDVHKIFATYFKGCETLAYALSSKLSEGNICLDIDEYKKNLSETANVFRTSPELFDQQCMDGKFVTHSDTELKPFVIHNGQAYLHRYFQYETQIIENIKRLDKNFRIITGGPGTGKTYSVSTNLVWLFKDNINLKVALAAPTGKAASRMNESIKDFAAKHKDESSIDVKSRLTD